MNAAPRIFWSVLFALTIAATSLKAGELPQDVYVWQRAWTPAVKQALSEHGAAFSNVVVLRAEVTWKKGMPQLAQAPLDYELLSKIKRPVGLALRIGPYSGTFEPTNAASVYLVDLAKKLLDEANAANIQMSELQLDFDCASSKLDGYRSWVVQIRNRIRLTRLVITALPSWLDRPEFQKLAQAAGAYVLQVHSLERPRNIEAPFTLCDPVVARRAVVKATSIGVPFRVALPTYGYILAFDSHGEFVGLSADGPQKLWPAETRLREVRSDPLQISQLVRDWESHRDNSLTGIIWYRLPVGSDILNWRWPTLNAMVEARTPRKSVRAKAHRVEPGLTEISLVNDGELDISSRLAVKTRWHEARLLAGDGLRGFEVAGQEVSSIRFETGARPWRLAAGDQQVIGWLRLSEDREVELELEEIEGR